MKQTNHSAQSIRAKIGWITEAIPWANSTGRLEWSTWAMDRLAQLNRALRSAAEDENHTKQQP